MNRIAGLHMAVAMLCICMLAVALGPGAFAQQGQIPELLEPVGVKVDTESAFISDIYDLAIYEASVNPHVEGLAFSVAGVVEEVNVIVGQKVQAGDVLITLDQEEQNKQIQRLEREIERIFVDNGYEEELAQIDRSILELELEMLMAQVPSDDDAIAMKQLDIEQFDLEVELEEEMRRLEQSRLQEELDALVAQIGQNVLTAPFDGTVLYLAELEKGSRINAFTQILFLADDSRMHIETEYIMESELKTADRIYAHVGGGIYDVVAVEQDERDFYSKVLAGETITTRFEVVDADDQVTLGAYAMVCLQKDFVADALVIPRNALYTESGNRYVYTVEDGVRARRDITVGVITDTLVEVTGGLEEGEAVYVQE